jgi:hypothetical protein
LLDDNETLRRLSFDQNLVDVVVEIFVKILADMSDPVRKASIVVFERARVTVAEWMKLLNVDEIEIEQRLFFESWRERKFYESKVLDPYIDG